MKGKMYEGYIENTGQSPDSVVGRVAWQRQLNEFYDEGKMALEALGLMK
jgi:hypothetical protein